MSAMKRMPGSDKPGKNKRPDGTPGRGRAGKGKTFGKPATGGTRGYKSGDSPESKGPASDKPYKSRKPYEGQGTGTDKAPRPWKKDDESGAPREKRFSAYKPSENAPYTNRKPFEEKSGNSYKPRTFKGSRDDKPTRPWKKDEESGAPRERRYSDDKPSGDRPYKSRKPYEGKSEGPEKHHTYKGSREDKPTRPWKKDEESGAPRERRYSDDKPSGDRPFKSRKPYEGKAEGTDRSSTYKGSRDDKPSRPWKKDEESGAPRERHYSDDKPSGDRPYKSRKPYEGKAEGTDRSSTYKGSRDDKPSRPWKKDEESGAPRERRFSDDKPAGDRPYKGRKPESGADDTYKPRSYRKPESDQPARPRKPEDISDAPRERRARREDSTHQGTGRRREDGEYSPKRKFQEKDEPVSHRREKSDIPRPKGDKGYGKDGTIRLNKFIANSGICSRREADHLIESGAVSINGKVVTELGTKITRDDKVQFGGETLNIEKKVYLLLNKPKGYITTVDDPQDRNTVMMLIKDACKERIYPVGRLDRNTSGLLLFTNDGETAKKLTHPGHKVRKVYHVELNKSLSKPDMMQLTEGIELEDGIMTVDEIAYTGSGDDKKNIGVVIHSGRNRVVRRMFESLEYEVVKLDRVAFANLTKKDLPRGRWRMLEQSEVNMLLML
jgi:23S rRNA pseudouridine2605 synthase